MMSEPWSILSTRYGNDIDASSPEQITAAVMEVVDPRYIDDIEHPDMWLRHGFDGGPMYVLTYSIGRRICFEQWNDQDYNSALASPICLEDVEPDEVIELMQVLASGDIDRVQRHISRNT